MMKVASTVPLTSFSFMYIGEAPKNLSGRLVAATWWLFGYYVVIKLFSLLTNNISLEGSSSLPATPLTWPPS